MSPLSVQTPTPEYLGALWAPYSAQMLVGATTGGGYTNAGTWGTQYLIQYVPIVLPKRVTVVSLAIGTGSTGTGYFILGIYEASGAKIVETASTQKAAANEYKVVDITDTTLTPGLYYLAAIADTSTDTYYRLTGTAPLPAAMGVLTETAGSLALPATATWVVNQTWGNFFFVGAHTQDVVA